MRVAFTGDVMLGRLVNNHLRTAPSEYPWGNTLPLLHEADLRVINLETTLTTSQKKVPKVFNFKSDPKNVQVLQKARIDVANVANNHILDYDVEGLRETLSVLDSAGIQYVGAGENLHEAKKPVIIEKEGVTVGILGYTDNEPGWAASERKPGVRYLSVNEVDAVIEDVKALKNQVDVIIVSLHWGPNMCQRPPQRFQAFAHTLIDHGVNIIHGHSAHIFQGVELYRGGLIMYDTGDFVDDYYVDSHVRNDCSFLFVVDWQENGSFTLKFYPTLIGDFQVNLSVETLADATMTRMQMLSQELGTELRRRNDYLEVTFEPDGGASSSFF